MDRRFGPQSLWEPDDKEAATPKSVFNGGQVPSKSRKADLFGSDSGDEAEFVSKASSKAPIQKITAKSSLFDSEDESKATKVSKLKPNLFDSDDDNPTINQNTVKSVDSKVTEKADATKLKGGIFDDEDEVEVHVVQKKDSTSTTSIKPATAVLAKPASSANLFDSEDSGMEDFAFRPQVQGVNAALKPAHSLFDSGSDSEIGSSTRQPADYRALYLHEMQRRQELESVVLALRAEVQALKTRLGDSDPVQPSTVACAQGEGAPPEQQLNENQQQQQPQQQSAEWEALAREEKLRRQKARSSGQHRGARTTGTSKRLSVGVQGSTHNTSHTQSADSTITKRNTVEGSKVAEEESDNEKADRFVLRSNVVSPVPVAGDADTVPLANADSIDAASEAKAEVEAEAVAVEELDPEAAKWRELALQEKQRKAMARRSVRTVRRPVPAAAVAATLGTLAAAAAPVVGGVGIAAEPHPHKPAAPSSALGGAAADSSRTVSAQYAANSDSDWDSHDSSCSEGEAPASAAIPRSGKNGSSNSNGGASEQLPRAHSNSAAINNHRNNNSSGLITAEQEAALDLRLKRWASGKPVWLLLVTVPQLAQQGFQSPAACALLLEGGAVQAAVQGMGEHSDASEVRKAYMKVIRFCHPDKHTQLDARSVAFLELQKLFTVLSDCYNRYKATLSN